MASWVFLFLALTFASRHILGMLDCDPEFVKNFDLHLSSKVPMDVPDRQAFLESLRKKILDIYRTSFRNKEYFRIIDIRSVAKLKKMVFDNLRIIEFHEMNTYMANIMKLEQELTWKMKWSLEHFADIACSQDCLVTEGPALDCWTCLRIRAQCFKGSVCREQDDLVIEKKELSVYLVLVVELAMVCSILILCYHCYKVKVMMLEEKISKHLWSQKALLEDGSHNI